MRGAWARCAKRWRTQLAQLQQTNAAKLDEMRRTVDEKLQTTLEARLGESFKQVADRLEQVHKGLGEMQTLAQGVGDLKHLLTNVKTRGIFGEAQLAALLEQVFTRRPVRRAGRDPAAAARTRSISPSSCRAASDRASRCGCRSTPSFPTKTTSACSMRSSAPMRSAAEVGGQGAGGAHPRWRPNRSAEKYLEPPHTTDFAILFLPTEGLYAEVLRRPGLMEACSATTASRWPARPRCWPCSVRLQMGFRTLALEKRSSEVWQVLGAVKTEFGKFGDVLAKVKSQTETVLNTLTAPRRAAASMGQALRKVEALPEARVQAADSAGQGRCDADD